MPRSRLPSIRNGELLDEMPAAIKQALIGYNLDDLRNRVVDTDDEELIPLKEALEQYDSTLKDIQNRATIHVVQNRNSQWDVWNGDPNQGEATLLKSDLDTIN